MDDEVKPRRYGRTAPVEPAGGPTTPPEDPTAAELAALRQEKADREKAEREAKDKELEELRAFKADKEKAPIVTPPVKKADKPADPATPPVTPPAGKTKRRGRSGASRLWFGEETDD